MSATTPTTVSSPTEKAALRALLRGHYDVQSLRVAFGNRLATHFRRGLGQEPGAPTDELSAEAQQLIEDLKAEYGLLADAVADCPPSRWQAMMAPHHDLALARKQEAIAREENALAAITPQQEAALSDKERAALKKRRVALATDKLGVQQGLIPYIQQPYDLAMARHYRAIEEDEDDLRAAIATLVKDFPIWDWLEGVRGVGPLMGAVIIAELDPHRAPNASCFWAYCFPAGTLISTPSGMVPIEAVKAADTVIDAGGLPTTVEDVLTRSYTGEMVTLDVCGSLPLTMTAEHPVLIERAGSRQWCAAQDVVTGDKVFVPRLRCESRAELRFDASTKAIGRSARLGKPMPITADIAYVLGRYVGDGCASTWLEDALYQRGRIQVVFGKDEEDEAAHYLGLAQAAFGGAALSAQPTVLRVAFGRATLAQRFQQWFGHGAHDKRLPASITGLVDPETIRSFLRGYLDADGHVVSQGDSAGAIMASSASAGLIFQMQSMLGKLGVYGAIHRQLRGAGPHSIGARLLKERPERYILSIPKSQVALIYPQSKATFNRAARMVAATPDGWMLRVKRVLRTAVTDRPVFNLRTASNTYLAQNIAVHNCGLGVKPDGLGQSRRKEHLVVQTYRAKDGTEQEKMGLGFSPFAKTKLVGVLGPSFLRAGGPYKTIYDQAKHRYESHPRYGLAAQEAGEKEAHKKHRHDMAIRYAVKTFLLDLWRTWRALEGLPVGESYAEAKLGLRHHRSA